jgi:hypothetical protein
MSVKHNRMIFSTGILMVMSSVAMATPVWDQGFETDTAGWFGNVTRVASGTNGISSASGGHHAIAVNDSGNVFSRFDGYRSAWPTGGMRASFAIFLDMAMTTGEGFDYAVAANGSDGAHQRDFVMHVTRDATGILIGGSNNSNFAPRLDLASIDHHLVTASGWFTFEHVFRDAGDGTLAVDMNLIDSMGNLLFTETRSDAMDVIATEIGGNRYGWLTHISVAGGIAIDDHMLAIPLPTPIAMASAGLLAIAGVSRRRAAR